MSCKIVVHGGAGTMPANEITSEIEVACHTALTSALSAGFTLMQAGSTAIDAVELAVKHLEDFELFNAGRGSVFTHNGKHEMDASIMDGKTGSAGSVAGVQHIKNPIALAKMVMQKSEHVFLLGAGAEDFARLHNVEFADDAYFFTEFRYNQLVQAREQEIVVLDHVDFNKNNTKNKFGTVGAVALDNFGNLAAATSTGGMTNKLYGRVGDSPVIGAGTYANNNTLAVSCTGHGEYFIRNVVAYDLHCLVEYKNMNLHQAASFLIQEKLKKQNAEGGLIAIDKNGNIALPFNTAGMYRGWMVNEQEFFTGIY